VSGTAKETEIGAARRAVASRPLWYHTMELAPGVLTPGWFDLRRGRADAVAGSAGTALPRRRAYDGFLSFEVERWTRPYSILHGRGHRADRGRRSLPERGLTRLLAGHPGVPHAAVLARSLAGP